MFISSSMNSCTLRTSILNFTPGSKPFSSKVAQAIHALRAPGQTTKLVADDDGFYIARYLSERAPKRVEYAAARDEIITKYHDVWRKQRFVALTDELARKHGAQVFADRLTSVPPRPDEPRAR